MKFKDYNINKAILEQLDSMGFVRATDIQYKAIKPILDGEDVMAIAQTGTGKTAAFAIPILQEIEIFKRKCALSGARSNKRIIATNSRCFCPNW